MCSVDLNKLLEGKELLQPSEHPVLAMPTRENLNGLINLYGVDDGVEKWNEVVAQREDEISKSEEDPLEYGFDLSLWDIVNACMDLSFDDIKIPEKWIASAEDLDALKKLINEFWLFGGNRSGKSEGSAKRVVHDALRCSGAMIWCLHSDLQSSIRQQQSLIWKYLPKKIKNLNNKRDRKGIYSIVYTLKNGFADNKLVLPNGSQIIFKYYSQDVGSVEGDELGDPKRGRCIGYWADELIPLDWVVTLRLRTATRGSIGLITFTPVTGYSPAVASVRMGDRTLSKQPAPLLPKKYNEISVQLSRMDAESWCASRSAKYLSTENGVSRVSVPVEWELLPRVSISGNENSFMFYFWSEENPFGNYPEVRRMMRGKDDAFIKIRAYGLAEKQAAAKFPMFTRKVHVVNHDRIPTTNVTRWMFCDPAGARNWFMLWFSVGSDGTLWVYREFPDQEDEVPGVGPIGEWAIPGSSARDGCKYDGLKGDAQIDLGWGLKEYKMEIARLEGWDDYNSDLNAVDWTDLKTKEEIYGRYLDARAGSSSHHGVDKPRTLQELLEEIGLSMNLTFKGESGSRNSIDEGVMMINNALFYKTSCEIGYDNHPKLYISERCKNLIFALENWTGRDGNKGATKDPIDLLRYAFLVGIYHYDRLNDSAISVRNDTSGGY